MRKLQRGWKLDPRKIQEIETFLLRILAMKIVAFLDIYECNSFCLLHSLIKGWTMLFTGNYLLN